MEKKRARRDVRLSNVCKSNGITLEQWQATLRKQAAEKETFGISEDADTDETGCYQVINTITRNIYKVIYRGEKNPWNFCSCMDFKSNQLGTCKHIEAVKLWLDKNKKKVCSQLPAYTSVYLSYTGKREVCIRIGTDNRTAYRNLAAHYFSPDGKLQAKSVALFPDFLTEARRISDTFRCYPDALQYILDLHDRKCREQLIDKKYATDGLDGLLKTELYPYQKEGIRFAFKAGKSIIADEMGLGKTIQAIGCAELLRKEKFVSSVLILCPSSLKYQWKKEIERFTGSESQVIEGFPLQRKQQYQSSAFYKIASYNSVCNDMKTQHIMHADMLIMDEAQRLKNWNTQIARAVHRIESDYTVVLSGTPLENKIQELYAIVQFVSPFTLGPYYRFVDFTTVVSNSGQIVGYRNLNVIGELLKPVLIRRRKRDVALQLPERMDQNLFVSMTDEQRAIHEECNLKVAQIVNKWQRVHFLSETDRKRLLLLLSQMRMVCDSTYILDQETRHDTKIDELMDILDNMKENGEEKVVIFSQWERMTRLVCRELDKRKMGYASLNGSVPSLKRKELMDRFTEQQDCRIFVSTDAGCTGLNLQVASLIVNLDIPWNPAVLEQRIGRIYRIGQKRNIQVVNFISERSIEERMLGTLHFKSNVAEGILDAGEDSVFLDTSRFNQLMEVVSEVSLNEEKKIQEKPPVFEQEEKLSEEQPLQQDVRFAFEEEKKDEPEEPAKDSPQELIHKGVSFFSQLAETLSSPEKTEQLVDSLIKEDKVTGKITMEIPVPDKESVKQVFQMLSQFFKNKS